LAIIPLNDGFENNKVPFPIAQNKKTMAANLP
jgi:hypothetical protein